MKKHIFTLTLGFLFLVGGAKAQTVNFSSLVPTGNTQTLSFDAGQGYKHRFATSAPQNSMARLNLQVTSPSQSSTFQNVMTFTTDGIVGIGTDFPNVITTPSAIAPADFLDYKLYVKKGIKTEKIVVEMSFVNTPGWGDFVFDSAYKLMPLTDLQKYIYQNHHLPEIPSAKEIEKKGIDVGEMQRLQMIKIEELTLYLLQMKEENDKLKERLEKLEKQQTNAQN